jgi:6-phosphogluconolactonase
MLGIGPDGHCASLFPDRGEVDSEAVVLAVRDSPKPPPVRITMGMPTLLRARHVVFVATGEEKADAVARSVAGGAVRETPAAGPRGIESTTWYVDDHAGARLEEAL